LQKNLAFQGIKTASFQTKALRLPHFVNCTQQIRAPPAASFGLLLNGCAVLPGPTRTVISDDRSSLTLIFSHPVAANGYFFTSSNLTSADYPLNWIVEVTRDCSELPAPVQENKIGCGNSVQEENRIDDINRVGDSRVKGGVERQSSSSNNCPVEDELRCVERTAFGASSWRLNVHGSLQLYPNRSFFTLDKPSSARIEVISLVSDVSTNLHTWLSLLFPWWQVDHRITWPWVFNWIVPNIMISIGW
jgi:hypothetical protein